MLSINIKIADGKFTSYFSTSFIPSKTQQKFKTGEHFKLTRNVDQTPRNMNLP